MGPKSRIIHEQPNIENTIPASLYQAVSPERFSLEDDDKFVIYGGGNSYAIQVLQNDPSQELVVCPELELVDYSNVSLFVLNTSLIVWFNSADLGLELPYQSIILHALHTLSDDTFLYLQILSNECITSIPLGTTEFVPSIEIRIVKNDKPGNPLNDNPLLVHNSNSSIETVYEAMSKCSAFHFDSDSEDESGTYAFDSAEQTPALEIPSHWLNNNVDDVDSDEALLRNTGIADDLEIDDVDETGNVNEVAAMHVDVGYASIAGSIRKRDEDDVSIAKARRVE